MTPGIRIARARGTWVRPLPDGSSLSSAKSGSSEWSLGTMGLTLPHSGMLISSANVSTAWMTPTIRYALDHPSPEARA